MSGTVIGTAIAVDCFDKVGHPENGIYFLTEGNIKCPLPSHVDKVYTSVYNARLLQKYYKVDPSKIVKLPLNQKLLIQDEIKELNFFVTLIDAKQKPGAVMFLFEGSEVGSILYAGKCCYNDNLVRHLDSFLKEKPLDYLYIYDACEGCHSHSLSVTSAVEEVFNKIRCNPNCKVFLIEPCHREDLLTLLKNKLKEKICVPEKVMKHFEEIGHSSGLVLDREQAHVYLTDNASEKWSDQQIIKIILLPCPVTKPVKLIEANVGRLEKRGYHIILYRNHCSAPELVTFVKEISAKHTVLIRPGELEKNTGDIGLDYWSHLGVDFFKYFQNMNKHLEVDMCVETESDLCDSSVEDILLSSVDCEERNYLIKPVKCDNTNDSIVSEHSSFVLIENDFESLVSKETVPNLAMVTS